MEILPKMGTRTDWKLIPSLTLSPLRDWSLSSSLWWRQFFLNVRRDLDRDRKFHPLSSLILYALICPKNLFVVLMWPSRPNECNWIFASVTLRWGLCTKWIRSDQALCDKKNFTRFNIKFTTHWSKKGLLTTAAAMMMMMMSEWKYYFF